MAKIKKYEDMNAIEKSEYFATGRCTAKQVSQYVRGKYITVWLPRVRGQFVRLSNRRRRHKTKEQALKAAIAFREAVRRHDGAFAVFYAF